MWQEEKVAHSKSLSEKFSNERLRGPNSRITTIFVRPKWNAIVEKILKPLEGWKGLPDKLCWEWRHRHYSDLVSGMSFSEAEYIHREVKYRQGGPFSLWPSTLIYSMAEDWKNSRYFESVDVIKDAKDMRFRMSASRRDEHGLREVALWGGIMNSSPEYGSSHVLGIGVGGAPEEVLGWAEATLGVFLLDNVLEQLRQMDSMLVGASLRKPIFVKGLETFTLSSDKTGTELDEIKERATLQYISEFNPIEEFEPLEGFHIFENEYLIVGVRHRAFRGVFTTVPDYPNDLYQTLEQDSLLEQFDREYYKKPRATNELKTAQEVVKGLFDDMTLIPEAPTLPADSETGQNQRLWLEKQCKEWPEKYEKIKKQLKAFDALIQRANEDGTNIAEELVKQLHVCFHLHKLYEDIKSFCEKETMVGEYRITWKEKLGSDTHKGEQIVLQHPRGGMSIDVSDASSAHERYQTMFGRPGEVFVLNIIGKPILKVIYHEEADGPYIHGGRGRVLECAPGKWPLLFLQAYFEVRASLTLRQMASLMGDVTATGS